MDIEYLNRFELKLEEELLALCTSRKMLAGVLLSSEDMDAKWHDLAPNYVADAVKEVTNYPVVSVAWAGYLGMAVAKLWDEDWAKGQAMPYANYYGERRFDDMDENIVKHILHLDLESEEAKRIEEILRACGEKTIDLIRYEQIEPQSVMAFHVFARSVKAMYRIGVALELYSLGYKFDKVTMADVVNQEKIS